MHAGNVAHREHIAHREHYLGVDKTRPTCSDLGGRSEMWLIDMPVQEHRQMVLVHLNLQSLPLKLVQQLRQVVQKLLCCNQRMTKGMERVVGPIAIPCLVNCTSLAGIQPVPNFDTTQ